MSMSDNLGIPQRTPEEHRAKAEQLLALYDHASVEWTAMWGLHVLTRAQVHATLATLPPTAGVLAAV